VFTGLIQHRGTVRGRRPLGHRDAPSAAERLEIHAPTLPGPERSPIPVPPLALGESIAVHGCCLTLAAIEGDGVLGFDVIPETLRVTRLGGLGPGATVHLERSATPATLLGGHLVQGHVDGVGRVLSVGRDGGEWRLRVAPPSELLRYVALKGSIAIDGVSLTVAAVDDAAGSFDVCLIPETLERTALGQLRAGDAVHIETDCLAKMVERLLAARR
jgi:riboflavin synthase